MIEQDIDRGIKAQALLTNPLFEEAFNDIRQGILEKWAASPIRDADGQHELRLMLKLIDEFKLVLEARISDGKLAAEELKRQSSKVNVLTRWIR